MKKHSHSKTAASSTPEEPTPAPNASTEPAPAAAAEPAATATTEEPSLALAEDLEAARAEATANHEKFLRATADLENYRKRATREKDELARYAREEVVSSLLPVLDNLERAIQAARDHGQDDSSLLEGIEHTHKQFKRTLEECGLVEVVSEAGHPFDPTHHEAVGHVESDDHDEGVILNQVQRGYLLSNRLLRPARVIVSKGPADAGDS